MCINTKNFQQYAHSSKKLLAEIMNIKFSSFLAIICIVLYDNNVNGERSFDLGKRRMYWFETTTNSNNAATCQNEAATNDPSNEIEGIWLKEVPAGANVRTNIDVA